MPRLVARTLDDAPPKFLELRTFRPATTDRNHSHPSAMLTEHFVAAISASTKPNTGILKDAGIFVHEFQPLAAQRHVFKKSTAAPNGIAVSATHVFAAQAEKAVVHVYSREKGNQEALVPFPERIHSIALAAQDSVLLLGTESGRILAWEVSCHAHAKHNWKYGSNMSLRFAQVASSPRPLRISSQ